MSAKADTRLYSLIGRMQLDEMCYDSVLRSMRRACVQLIGQRMRAANAIASSSQCDQQMTCRIATVQ